MATKKKTRKPTVVSADITRMAIDFLRKETGEKDSADTLARGCRSEVKEVLPTGIDVLDRHVIGIGGLPYGRIVEIYGKESSGKSSLAWQIMAAGQRDGALVAFGEAEPALAPAWVDKFGCDREKVVALGCDTLEQFAYGVDKLLTGFKQAKKFVFVLDSVAGLASEAEFADKAEVGDAGAPGEMARGWSRVLRRMSQKLAKRNALLVLINQLRSKIGVTYGPKEEPPGGKAIAFYSSVRLNLWHGETEKKGEKKIGQWSGVRAVKNKLAPPLVEANMFLSFDGGWDDDATTMKFAKKTGAAGKDDTIADARRNLGWERADEQTEGEKTT